MNVRQASALDMPEIVEMYKDYSGELLEPLGFKYNQEEVRIAVGGLIESGTVFVFEKDELIRGAIAGLYLPSMMSKDKIFSIMFFYVQPRFRIGASYFLERIEPLLEEKGATKIAIAVMNHEGAERAEKLYEVCGFQLLEKHYIKNLSEVLNAQ